MKRVIPAVACLVVPAGLLGLAYRPAEFRTVSDRTGVQTATGGRELRCDLGSDPQPLRRKVIKYRVLCEGNTKPVGRCTYSPLFDTEVAADAAAQRHYKEKGSEHDTHVEKELVVEDD